MMSDKKPKRLLSMHTYKQGWGCQCWYNLVQLNHVNAAGNRGGDATADASSLRLPEPLM